MKIEHLVSIDGAILVVYYTSGSGYQYEIVFWDGSLYQPQEIYYTAAKALEVGTESIKIVIGYQ